MTHKTKVKLEGLRQKGDAVGEERAGGGEAPTSTNSMYV